MGMKLHSIKKLEDSSIVEKYTSLQAKRVLPLNISKSKTVSLINSKHITSAHK
jgi:hypothetical protein